MLTDKDLEKIDQLIIKRVRPLKKDIGLVISLFDREYLDLRKRIEEHLKLPSQ